MTVYFDMDGTIANFYGVENWLEYLINENTLKSNHVKGKKSTKKK